MRDYSIVQEGPWCVTGGQHQTRASLQQWHVSHFRDVDPRAGCVCGRGITSRVGKINNLTGISFTDYCVTRLCHSTQPATKNTLNGAGQYIGTAPHTHDFITTSPSQHERTTKFTRISQFVNANRVAPLQQTASSFLCLHAQPDQASDAQASAAF